LERFNPVSRAGELISMIDDLDHVLSTNKAFSLSSWLDAARAWANATATTFTTPRSFPPSTSTPNVGSQTANFYEYDARNQITLWSQRRDI
jgi:hypothetical protein